MHKVPADEFRIVQGDLPVWTAGLPGTGRKSYFPFVNIQDAAVGNGDLMCISSKIFDGIAKTVEGFFDIRTPVFSVKFVPECGPFIGVL